jgi:hypothetical protein
MIDRTRAGRAGAALRAGLMVVGTLRLAAAGAALAPVDDVGPWWAEIESTNAAPTANDDKASIDSGRTLEDRAPGLLFNDVDPDGDPLVATRASVPANGTAIVRRDGSWSYTPAAGFAGTDSFTYVVSDGLLTSAPATVSITVRGRAGMTPTPSIAPSASPAVAPSPSPTGSPSPTDGPSAVPAVSPPTPPLAEPVFSVPERPAGTVDIDDIGLEASSVAGLGPALWTAPTVFLGVPGLLLVLTVVRRGGRSRGRGARRAPSRQPGAATRS